SGAQEYEMTTAADEVEPELEVEDDGEVKVDANAVIQNSGQKHRELVFRNDTLRKNADIRNIPDSQLTWYQRLQLQDVRKRTVELSHIELKKRIFATFDYNSVFQRNRKGMGNPNG